MYGAFCLQAVGTLAVGFTAYWSIQSVSNAYHHISHINLAKAQQVSEMRYHSSQVARLLARMAMPGSTSSDLERLSKKYHTSVKEYEAASNAFGKLPFSDGEKEKFAATVKQWDRLEEVATKAVSLVGSGQVSDRDEAIGLIQKEIREIGEIQGRDLEALAEFQSAEAKVWVQSAADAEARGNRLTLILVFIGFSASMIVARQFSKRLTESLSVIVEWLSGGSLKVASASHQISEASTELSQGANEQAAAVQQTASSMQEISAMVSKNAENARQSQELSEKSRGAVATGKDAVGEVLVSISEIQTANGDIISQVKQSNQEIAKIVKLIDNIGQKTKVINEIVFQTKLLSFNASVEAARAGEHGRGFAIVAEEVGNLAQMSGAAAREINQLLSESIQSVEAIVHETKERVDQLVSVGEHKVQNGLSVAKRCASTLEEVVSHVNAVNERVNEIANASSEQATGIHEISRAMVQLDSVTQQNARVSLDTASASEVLTDQAGELRTLVEKLRVLIHGQSVPAQNVTPLAKSRREQASDNHSAAA